MSGKLVSETQLRERLLETGKTDAEIEQLMDRYVEASGKAFPDEVAISKLLQKSQQDRTLRVKGFKLTKEQFDILVDHYHEAEESVPEQEVDATHLVQKALGEFIDLLS